MDSSQPAETAIELLRQNKLPADWKWVLCTNKAAFAGEDPTKGPGIEKNGRIQYPKDNTGTNAAPISTEQALARWEEESWRIREKDNKPFRVRKTGVGVATGDASGGLIAVDLDGPAAERLLKEKLGDEYPDLQDPGTMSWTGRPGRRQLLYQMPKEYRASFTEFTSKQIFDDLKNTSEEANVRYNKKYSVLPGSYHPDTKKQYTWISYNDGIVAEAPGWLIKFMLAYSTAPLDPSFLPESYLERTAKTEFSGKQLRGIFWGPKDGDGGLCKLLTSNDEYFKKFFDTPVWADDYQPLVEENTPNYFKGGCPFHDSNSGTSFFLNKNNLGFYCHKEEVKGDGIQFVHAFKTGNITAGDPSPVQLEYYIQEICQIVGKKYPEDFQNVQKFKKETKYDVDRPLLDWIRTIEEGFENPAEMEIELMILADNYGIRKSPADLLFLLAKDEAFRSGGGLRKVKELCDTAEEAEFIIPELLQKPQTVVIHGESNAGKTATVIALAKHVLHGQPFKVRDEMMPVDQGPVIWFNGDCSATELKQAFSDADLTDATDFYEVSDFKLSHRKRFQQYIKKVKPKLVVIDSLSSCLDDGVDENRREAAIPLYFLNNKNGTLWPSCSIVIIHHDNKEGGYRGHSAIKGAVSEMWQIQEIPEDRREHLPNYRNQRMITNRKTRSGLKNRVMLATLNEDFTVCVEDWHPEVIADEGGRPSVMDTVLRALRRSQEPLKREEVEAFAERPKGDAAVRKSLQRLKAKGLVDAELIDPVLGTKVYWAVTASRGDRDLFLSQVGLKPVVTREVTLGQPWDNPGTNLGQTPDSPPDISKRTETDRCTQTPWDNSSEKTEMSQGKSQSTTQKADPGTTGGGYREHDLSETHVRQPLTLDELIYPPGHTNPGVS